jgi:transposase
MTPRGRSFGIDWGPSSKSLGRATQKNQQAADDFKANVETTLRETLPPDARSQPTSRTIRLFSQDESRFGLITVQRRRITLKGVKPIGVFQQKFESFYLYGAVEVATGASFFQEADKCNAETFGHYLKGLSETYPDSLNLLLLDNGRQHTAKTLEVPENVRLVFLPPYSPELNPIERFWQAVKDQVAWLTFETLDPLRKRVQAILSAFSSAQLQSLTGYAYLLQALLNLNGSFL